MQTKKKFMGKNYVYSFLKNNNIYVVLILLLVFNTLNMQAQCSGVNTDGDGIVNLCDVDDDNDGILDINELCSTVPGAASPDTTNRVYWSLNGFDVYTIGGNTNGLGYQESGFEEGAYGQGKSLTVLNGTNDFTGGNQNHGTAINTTISFGNGTMKYVSNHPTNNRAELSDNPSSGFVSGNSGDAAYLEPELGLGVGDYYSIEIDFTTPVTAFSLDIVDAFDTFTTNNPELSYQVYADGKLIAYLKGTVVGDDITGTVNIYDANDNLKGSHMVGQNLESSIGFVTLESVSQVVIRHDVISGSIRSGSYDPHGFDGFAYSTDFCDTDGDGIANHLDTDSDNDGCPDAIEGNGGILDTTLLVDLVGGSTGGSIQNLGDSSDVNGSPIVNGSGFQQDTTAEVIDDNISKACTVDLSLTKTVSEALPKVGDTVIFTITVKNNGLLNATGIDVTDVLPMGLNYSGTYTASKGTYDTGTDVWTIGSIDINETEKIDITVTVSDSGTIINTAEIANSNQTDIDSLPNNGN